MLGDACDAPFNCSAGGAPGPPMPRQPGWLVRGDDDVSSRRMLRPWLDGIFIPVVCLMARAEVADVVRSLPLVRVPVEADPGAEREPHERIRE
eukprot:5373985-Heterocapsa_arctica.AAC.1